MVLEPRVSVRLVGETDMLKLGLGELTVCVKVLEVLGALLLSPL